MASCITSKWGNSYSPQVKLTVTTKSQTDTAATLAWTLSYVTHGYAAYTNGVGRSYSVKINGSTVKSGTFNINGKTSQTIASGTTTVAKGTSAKSVSFSLSFYFDVTWNGTYAGTKTASGSITVAKKTSYTVSFNANGGTGAPSAQTKWHGTALKLSTTKPTRTGYTFKGWSTSSTATSAAYAAGGSYTANASDTLYAVWSINAWKVTFDANGGEGGPTSATKIYGTAMTIPAETPTRDGYDFAGWGTSANAEAAAYQAGGSYAANAAITLYAVWKVSYWVPRISDLKALRCEQDGTLSDYGTYALVTFAWECCQESGENQARSIEVTSGESSYVAEASGTSGSGAFVVGEGLLDMDGVHTVTVAVTDSLDGRGTADATLHQAKFIIDMMREALGVAFGKAAELPGFADFAYRLLARNGMDVNAPVVSNAAADPGDTSAYQFQIVNGQEGTNTYYSALREDTGAHVLLGVGAGGVNHGVYSVTNDRWMLYYDTYGLLRTAQPLLHHLRTVANATDKTLTNSVAKLDMSTANWVLGTNDFLTVSGDGGVQCNRDGYVRVSGVVHANNLTKGDSVQAQFYNGSTGYAASYANSGDASFVSVALTPRIMGVSAGDVIYLAARNYTASRGKVSAGGNTYMMVEYVG